MDAITSPLARFGAQHVRLAVDGKVATITLDRPARKNALTFESYNELLAIFRAAADDRQVRTFVLTGAGGDFCSGGDVHEIIGPLLNEKDKAGRRAFTQLTGDVVKAMIAAPQPIIAAIGGVCAGAGAALAMASDIRIGTADAKIAFLFNRVGLSGADMGACAMLPRIIGQGRAAELLLTGRTMRGDEAERCGFFHRVVPPDNLLTDAQKLAREIAGGPGFANAVTKRQLAAEWNMPLAATIDAEAAAQAECMEHEDFARAYRAFAARQKPVFE